VGKVFSVVGGHGAPGRSTLALNVAALLGRVAATVLVDADLGAPILSARLGANTNKNLVTLARMAPAAPDEWTAALSRDLQPIVPDDSPHGLFLAGLPRADAQLPDGFLDVLIDALRARFAYVVCDTGVQWLDGDRTARVPVERADTLLLVATPDVGGVRRARHALDRLRTSIGPARLGVVINQHRSHRDYDRWELEYAFGEPLSAVLPFDPNACWRATERKRPAVFTDHRSALSRLLVQLAERLHGGRIELPRTTGVPGRPAWSWRAWLGRLEKTS
jgi:Flp pilus assembly CpaE family ATPase